MTIEVNGQIVSVGTVPSSGGWNSVRTKEIQVSLKDGLNYITVYSENGYAPDLDMLQIVPL